MLLFHTVRQVSQGNFTCIQKNNAPFMTKNINFAFFPWTLWGHSKKNTDIYAKNVVHDDKYMSPYMLDYKVLVLKKICSL